MPETPFPEDWDFRPFKPWSLRLALRYERLRSHSQGRPFVEAVLEQTVVDWTDKRRRISYREALSRDDKPRELWDDLNHALKGILPLTPLIKALAKFPEPLLKVHPNGSLMRRRGGSPLDVYKWPLVEEPQFFEDTFIISIDRSAHLGKIEKAFKEWLKSEKTFKEGRGDRRKNLFASFKKLSALRLARAHLSFLEAQEIIGKRQREVSVVTEGDVLPQYRSRSRWDTNVREAEEEILEEFADVSFPANL